MSRVAASEITLPPRSAKRRQKNNDPGECTRPFLFSRLPPVHEHRRHPLFYPRALYDFDTADPSCISFRTNDVLEILRTDTGAANSDGWWDVAGSRPTTST
ncbi:hypothetical protein PUNSTDRAFT_131801 [Punctularia strigosozonata HHB-11173 SS5]|uniref:uncharacterized protein n=1 Tax=Punctularia strigosozonata (strain HHB-11173) TaxID=741275 RepID=UPI0004417B6F|nr:uncharacterized protein PUNSTDRAFT_131801 [Punctularia strigosozonata HHB-11173 SS5]EIN11642.1 hypothetical protein PUNSTDRAFT_131801 [Punctularia strigosozonata HHB-11173 SS5]